MPDISYRFFEYCGVLIERLGRFVRAHAQSRTAAVFLNPDAIRINEARLRHLASLGLPLAGRTVLEVGAGVGLLAQFFEELGCAVTSTDARPQNVAEIRRRYPNRNAKVLDLEKTTDLGSLGRFDIVFCYGLLYHLADPDRALRALSEVCVDILLLETCVTPGQHLSPHSVPEDRHSKNQSVTGWGCRPTRPWIMDRLLTYFEFAYVTKTQPRHPDFDSDWVNPLTKPLHRAVFVGSRTQLKVPTLLVELPEYQKYTSD